MAEQQINPGSSQEELLKAALADMFALIDEQQLVRNTSRDHEEGYYMRQINFVRRLANAKEALEAESQQHTST